MSNGLVGFLSYKNKHPSSPLEAIGDALISPVTTLFNHNSFVVLTNRQTDARCYYSHTNTSTPRWLVVIEVVGAIATLPIALLGYTLKGLSLLTSPKTRAIYTNWTPPFVPSYSNPARINPNDYHNHGLSQRAQNTVDLGAFVSKMRLAPQFLDEILAHPAHYLAFFRDWLAGDQVSLYPFLECACVNSGNFNRLRNQRRQHIEQEMITDAERLFPNKGERLVYLDLGAGRLLQTFFNVGRLIHAGYQNLKIVLIDPSALIHQETHFSESREGVHRQVDIAEGTESDALQAFREFCKNIAEQKGIQIEVHPYRSISDYKAAFPEERPQIATAIDFDDFSKAFNDVVLTHQTLDPQGRFYLAFDQYDFTFGAAQALRTTFHQKRHEVLTTIERNVREAATALPPEQRGEMRLAMLGKEFDLEKWTRLLPATIPEGCKTVHLTLETPQKRNYFGASIGPSEEFTPANLQLFLRLFLPQGVDLHVEFVQDVATFAQPHAAAAAPYNHVMVLGHLDREEIVQAQVQQIRHLHPTSQLYFLIQGHREAEEGQEPQLTFNGMWR